jgi:hypothetical protein
MPLDQVAVEVLPDKEARGPASQITTADSIDPAREQIVLAMAQHLTTSCTTAAMARLRDLPLAPAKVAVVSNGQEEEIADLAVVATMIGRAVVVTCVPIDLAKAALANDGPLQE